MRMRLHEAHEGRHWNWLPGRSCAAHGGTRTHLLPAAARPLHQGRQTAAMMTATDIGIGLGWRDKRAASCDMVCGGWHGMPWHSMAQNGAARRGMAWHGMAWHGAAGRRMDRGAE